eukprot:1560025-Rhodomonas_salina.1
MSRSAIFDAIVGTASKEYDGGHVQPGEDVECPANFRDFMSFLEAHYYDPSILTFLSRDGGVHQLRGECGVQQGDPAAASMFATGQQPVLIRLAKRHERVFIVAYADNIFL